MIGNKLEEEGENLQDESQLDGVNIDHKIKYRK